MKKARIAVAFVVLVIAALTALAWAHPFSVTCPIDGESMYFDHQVGYGANAVCWYSHYGCDPRGKGCGKHEAYASCGD